MGASGAEQGDGARGEQPLAEAVGRHHRDISDDGVGPGEEQPQCEQGIGGEEEKAPERSRARAERRRGGGAGEDGVGR